MWRGVHRGSRTELKDSPGRANTPEWRRPYNRGEGRPVAAAVRGGFRVAATARGGSRRRGAATAKGKEKHGENMDSGLAEARQESRRTAEEAGKDTRSSHKGNNSGATDDTGRPTTKRRGMPAVSNQHVRVAAPAASQPRTRTYAAIAHSAPNCAGSHSAPSCTMDRAGASSGKLSPLIVLWR